MESYGRIETFNPFTLQGKKILVTGASSGIGRQCVIDCSRMGATVILLARNEERLQETFSHLYGSDHQIIVADLTAFDTIPSMVETIVSRVGKVDGLVNCAGISTTLPLKLMTTTKLDEFFRTNVYSAVELSKEVSKKKNMNEGGSIVFLSSVMGVVGESGKSLYSMTKGALLSAARSLACEFAKRRIRFNCISPGAILTPINENLPHMTDPEKRQILEGKHLFGLGRPEDVAYACIYLLSDASKWVTGQNLIVDGGYTVR
ncbi:MAG: SDR family oxidoreductase [Muribaculaceae bacterium]|nr:SDR family oxidoreductase [Muribaculaceae bacterium]MDE6796024.1 SDR family oxidoreductase [Muribaculaceae bacterium]